MKTPPKIPENVAQQIINWIEYGGSPMASTVKIHEIKEFYDSLGIKHDNKPYYRGLKISPKGFDKFMETGKLHLFKDDSESWTCDLDTAEAFLPERDHMLTDRLRMAGFILKINIPKNRVLFNLDEIFKLYQPKFGGKSIFNITHRTHSFFGEKAIRALREISRYGECELVTKTVCTKCNLDNVITMTFSYRRPKSHREKSEQLLQAFLSTLNLAGNSKVIVRDIQNLGYKGVIKNSRAKVGIINMSKVGNSWRMWIV